MEGKLLEEILLQRFLQSPELAELIDRRAEQKYKAMIGGEVLTRKEMAQRYGNVSVASIDRLNEEELKDLGWKKIRLGSRRLFERITIIEASREIFRNIKKHSRHENK